MMVETRFSGLQRQLHTALHGDGVRIEGEKEPYTGSSTIT